MLITYNLQPNKKIAEPLGTVSNLRAHPHLSVRNLAVVLLLRLLQGKDGVYFCSSYTTPGNGG